MPIILLLWWVAVLTVFLPILPASVFSWRRWWKPRIVVLMWISWHRRHVILILLLNGFFPVIIPRILRTMVVLLLVGLLIRRIVGSRVVLSLIHVLLVLHSFVILPISLILSSWSSHLWLSLILVWLIWRSSACCSADLLESDVHKL